MDYYAKGKIIEIIAPIVILIIIGILFVINKNNRLSQAISCDKYDSQKVSVFLGLSFIGIAISCLPSFLSVILNQPGLNLISIILTIVVIGFAIYINQGRKLVSL